MAKGIALSILEKLLLAALWLEESGKRPFSGEDLVVSAWQHFPDAFGLAGYKDNNGRLLYPDSDRVMKNVISTTPIRKHGLLKKVGKKVYQLTEAGRDQARLLSTRESNSTYVEKISVSRESAVALRRLFTSKVLEKFKDNRIEEITFFDACSFWGISPRSSAIELEGKIANFEKIVETAKDAAKNKIVSFEHSGDTFGESDLELLLQIHKTLLKRFQQELEVIQQRTDERG